MAIKHVVIPQVGQGRPVMDLNAQRGTLK